MKNIRIPFLLILSLVTLGSCSTKSISYQRKKIIRKYTPSYTIKLNDKKIDFLNTYLDKDNIAKTILDKKLKTLNIVQIDTNAKFLRLIDIEFDSLPVGVANNFAKRKIEMLILNGEFVSQQKRENTKIEFSAIKNTTIILAMMTICREPKGNILIIQTK